MHSSLMQKSRRLYIQILLLCRRISIIPIGSILTIHIMAIHRLLKLHILANKGNQLIISIQHFCNGLIRLAVYHQSADFSESAAGLRNALLTYGLAEPQISPFIGQESSINQNDPNTQQTNHNFILDPLLPSPDQPALHQECVTSFTGPLSF